MRLFCAGCGSFIKYDVPFSDPRKRLGICNVCHFAMKEEVDEYIRSIKLHKIERSTQEKT